MSYDIGDLDFLITSYPRIGRGLEAAKNRILELEAELKDAKFYMGENSTLFDDLTHQTSKVKKLEAALRGLLDTILVDGCRYGNAKQRMAQMKAQELLDPVPQTETKGEQG